MLKTRVLCLGRLLSACLLLLAGIAAVYSQSEKLYGVWENKAYSNLQGWLERGYRFTWNSDGKGFGADTEDPGPGLGKQVHDRQDLDGFRR